MSVSYWEFIHPDDQHAMVESGQQLIAGTDGSRYGYEVRMLGRDGRYRWTRWNARTIPAEQLLYAIGVDISDTRPREEEQVRAGAWEWQLRADEMRWSAELLDLLGLPDRGRGRRRSPEAAP